jgi:peptidoglycan/LPS O-acetylase OafA/YrhL
MSCRDVAEVRVGNLLQVRYRPEIDGLRAVAVVPVILFHAGIDAFGGGFVGVDVFFVISGYLITSIILAEQQEGTFSLLSFYERRARRILPALFLVMAASSLMAWLLFYPSDLEAFSRSVIATALFSSNFLFWHETGYFDTAAELKPLLHTWSLAVEEQYYILFPLFLMAMWRVAQSRTALALLLLGVASLVLAEWGAHKHPEAAFFLLPFRLWELALGALAALYLSGRQPTFGLRLSQVGSGVGLALILWAVFRFDKNTPFPGFNALVPTVGAALIILFATPSTLIGRLLSTRLLVGVGLISYSAYLWHQPLLAFSRYKSLTEPPVWAVLGICSLTFFLAYLCWRFIELPLRRRETYSRKAVFMMSATGITLATAFGMSGASSRGFEDRFVASLSDRQKAVWHSNASADAGRGECHLRINLLTERLHGKVWRVRQKVRPSHRRARRFTWHQCL